MADGVSAGDTGKKLFMPSEACPISPESTRTGSSQGWPKAKVYKSSVDCVWNIVQMSLLRRGGEERGTYC